MSKGQKIDLFSIKSIDPNKTNFFKTMAQDETKEKRSSEEIKLVALNKVCERYENLFIQDPLALKGLVESVKEIGFTDPIRIMKIEDKLAALTKAERKDPNKVQKEYMDNEFNYLVKKKDEGYEYVVVSGHRRLQASFVIAMEIIQNKTPDYSADVDKEFRSVQGELFNKYVEFHDSYIPNLDYEKDEIAAKYESLYIPCIIVDEAIDFDKEDRMYKDTNITTREITQFEIITNLYKELQRKGELEQFLKPNGTYNFASIANYINKKFSKDINPDTLRRTIRVNNTLDEEFLNFIYNSKLTVFDAYKLLGKYDSLSAAQIKEIKGLIQEGNFKIDAWIKNNTKQKPKKKSVTRKVFIGYLNDIKSGKKTVDEILEIMNKQ